jgi:hypothetical protein
MQLNSQPSTGQVMVIRSVPGAEDYEFRWHLQTRRMTYQHLPDHETCLLAERVDKREMAMVMAHIFALGVRAASTVRMCRWPNS